MKFVSEDLGVAVAGGGSGVLAGARSLRWLVVSRATGRRGSNAVVGMSDPVQRRTDGAGRWQRKSVRGGGRSVYQQVTLTEEEQGRLRARAQELGVSVPRLMVESTLGDRTGLMAGSIGGGAERRRMLDSLFEIERLLATIANNVNQLARQANTTGELPAATGLSAMRREVLEVVRELRGLTGMRRP